LDQLSKEIITRLSTIFDDSVAITFTPKKSDGIPAIEEFIKIHGQIIHSLNLKGFEYNIDDELIKKLIQSTPNLCELFISCFDLTGEGLGELGTLKNLKILNLASSGLTQLPENLPAGLSTLILSHCYRLKQLPENLPASLTTLNLSFCCNLTKLPKNLPAGLTLFNPSYCCKITKLPKTLPAGLESLDFSGCYCLTKLPKALPAGLRSLYLINCNDLNDNARLKAFSSMLDKNFDQGLSLLSNFAISDKIKLREILLPRLEKKFTDPSIIPERLLLIANFIYPNHNLLGLHEEHPLMQEAINIILIND